MTVPRCNGKKRGEEGPTRGSGEWAGEGYCKQKAGWGTDHTGSGRCKLHGGATPVKHGRYSPYKQHQLTEEVQRHLENPDPLDLTHELAVTRALLEDFLEKQADLQDALLRWHLEAEERPSRLPSLHDAVGMVEALSRIVKRIQDIRSENAVSRPELARIYSEMWRAVQTHAEPETAGRIGEAWTRIDF